MTIPDFTPQGAEVHTDHGATETQQRELGIITSLAMQQPAQEALPSEEVIDETETPQRLEERFNQFMRELSIANYAAYEEAVSDFSFHGTATRSESMRQVIERYSGFVTEATSQPDEVVSPDAPLSEE